MAVADANVAAASCSFIVLHVVVVAVVDVVALFYFAFSFAVLFCGVANMKLLLLNYFVCCSC